MMLVVIAEVKTRQQRNKPGIIVAAGAMAIGGLLGALLAWLAIRFHVDQIIAGVVITITGVRRGGRVVGDADRRQVFR